MDGKSTDDTDTEINVAINTRFSVAGSNHFFHFSVEIPCGEKEAYDGNSTDDTDTEINVAQHLAKATQPSNFRARRLPNGCIK